MEQYYPILLGLLLGGGILLAFYGVGRVRNPDLPRAQQRLGLLMVNAGIIAALLSMALMIWGG